MWDGQQGLCAICHERLNKPQVIGGPGMLGTDKQLAIDHDHKTGIVRALLCSSCNTGLGLFRDSPRLLAQAIVYLEEHGTIFNVVR
jgi:hypothetical protein